MQHTATGKKSFTRQWWYFSITFNFTILLLFLQNLSVLAHTSNYFDSCRTRVETNAIWGIFRGGASSRRKSTSGSGADAFALLTQAIEDNIDTPSGSEQAQKAITNALKRLAAAQKTFKGLDGAAHEAYQRTRSTDEVDTTVLGRAQRSADRLGATAQAFLACELIETLQEDNIPKSSDETTATINDRQVVLHFSNNTVQIGSDGNLSVLVLYEDSYVGGAGSDHGKVEHLIEEQTDDARQASSNRIRSYQGRLLIVLCDPLSQDLIKILKILDQKPKQLYLSSRSADKEVVSVQPALYECASDLLETLDPILRAHNTSAIHFIGRSLSGGVASLAATILDGSLPLPKNKRQNTQPQQQQQGRRRSESKRSLSDREMRNKRATSAATNDSTVLTRPLCGLGRSRASALSLGAPPCLSSNVFSAFCTSFMYGDDVVCRSSPAALNRLYERVNKQINGGLLTRNIGWMSDTISLTVSNLKTNSPKEKLRLSVAGVGYLIHPRRLGGLCSIHEVGGKKKGGTEALRAAVLWQLNDILLSKSLWKHHQLDSYIHGLDRVHLRGLGDADDIDEEG